MFGCIQGIPPILINIDFIFTSHKHKNTSSYIFITDFEIKFTWSTFDSSHIAAYPLKANLDPTLCYVRNMFTLNPAKIVPMNSVSFINSKRVRTLYLTIKEN